VGTKLPTELEQKFAAIQTETQKKFVQGDFAGSIQSGMAALELTKEMPPHIATTEIVQIQLNCSSAYMQMKKFPEAVVHAELATQEAEKGLKLRGGQPQAIEVLAITLSTYAFSLLHLNRLDEASVAAEKSLMLAERIYPAKDFRQQKPVRCLAVVRERQGKMEEAEKLFLRSYLLCLSLGPHTTEAQMSNDELCNMMMKRGDLAGAEKYARSNYKAFEDKTLDERGELILADSASRLAQVLRRLQRLPEAEELLLQTLSIREAKLVRTNPIGIAFTLVQLAAVQEEQGKVGTDVEAKLMTALEIFGRLRGQASPEVRNTLNQLRNVRTKRTGVAPGGGSGGVAGQDDDGGLQYSVSEESKGRVTSSSSSSSSSSSGSPAPGAALRSTGLRTGSPGTAPAPAGGGRPGPAPDSGLSDTEELAKLKFAPDDGMARMMAANTFFEQGRFSCAEVVIAQALPIFLKQHGPDHQLTQAARQNLNVARANGINKLWMQVVSAMVLEQGEKVADGTLFLFVQTLCFVLLSALEVWQ
jgi:tetratricopeptide (TPR) repeat protein